MSPTHPFRKGCSWTDTLRLYFQIAKHDITHQPHTQKKIFAWQKRKTEERAPVFHWLLFDSPACNRRYRYLNNNIKIFAYIAIYDMVDWQKKMTQFLFLYWWLTYHVCYNWPRPTWWRYNRVRLESRPPRLCPGLAKVLWAKSRPIIFVPQNVDVQSFGRI